MSHYLIGNKRQEGLSTYHRSFVVMEGMDQLRKCVEVVAVELKNGILQIL